MALCICSLMIFNSTMHSSTSLSRASVLQTNSTVLLHSLSSKYLCLHRLKLVCRNNAVMMPFHVILWHFPVVHYRLVGKEVLCKSLLKECVPFVLFVLQNAHHRTWMPFLLPGRCRHSHFSKFTGYFISSLHIFIFSSPNNPKANHMHNKGNSPANRIRGIQYFNRMIVRYFENGKNPNQTQSTSTN